MMFLVLASSAYAQKAGTVTGDIVDVISFVATGKQDVEGARRSASAGNPLGLYDSNANKLYLIGLPEIGASANDRLVPYLGVRVFVKGKVYTKKGTNLILMSDIGKSIK